MRLREDLNALPLEEFACVVAYCAVIAAQQVIFCINQLYRNVCLQQMKHAR